MAIIQQMISQINFLSWKLLNLCSNLLTIRSHWSNKQEASVGSDNGLAPDRHQANVWTRARFLCFAWSKLRLCSANHRTGYFSNLACDWLSIVWGYSEQETENGPSIELVYQSIHASPRLNKSKPLIRSCKKFLWETLKSDSCHDAKFVVTSTTTGFW